MTLFVASREKLFLQQSGVSSPNVSVLPLLLYFFGMVAVIGIILFLVPISKFKIIFRFLFAFMFGWGVFIVFALVFPMTVAYVFAGLAIITWFFWAKVWLHDILFIFVISAASSVFGFLFSPWTFIIFMLVVSVYDVLAVRFRYMLWMVDKFSDMDIFPGFFYPKEPAYWNKNLLKTRVGNITKEEAGKREYMLLGGGDISFPLMLTTSVFFDMGFNGAITVGLFALAGLMGAFLIQIYWLKGRPMPALPPIAFASILGFLISKLVF